MVEGNENLNIITVHEINEFRAIVLSASYSTQQSQFPLQTGLSLHDFLAISPDLILHFPCNKMEGRKDKRGMDVASLLSGVEV